MWLENMSSHSVACFFFLVTVSFTEHLLLFNYLWWTRVVLGKFWEGWLRAFKSGSVTFKYSLRKWTWPIPSCHSYLSFSLLSFDVDTGLHPWVFFLIFCSVSHFMLLWTVITDPYWVTLILLPACGCPPTLGWCWSSCLLTGFRHLALPRCLTSRKVIVFSVVSYKTTFKLSIYCFTWLISNSLSLSIPSLVFLISHFFH